MLSSSVTQQLVCPRMPFVSPVEFIRIYLYLSGPYAATAASSARIWQIWCSFAQGIRNRCARQIERIANGVLTSQSPCALVCAPGISWFGAMFCWLLSDSLILFYLFCFGCWLLLVGCWLDELARALHEGIFSRRIEEHRTWLRTCKRLCASVFFDVVRLRELRVACTRINAGDCVFVTIRAWKHDEHDVWDVFIIVTISTDNYRQWNWQLRTKFETYRNDTL